MKWILLFLFTTVTGLQISFLPIPEILLRAIPSASNVRNIPISKIREVNTRYESILNCTTDSVISKIIENVESVGNKTCNGFVFSNEEYLYYGLGSGKAVKLLINEMTVVSVSLNGNTIFITCGHITEGVCIGDYLFSAQIYIADDQDGCSGPGLNSQTAIYYSLNIFGKCNSTCNLDESSTMIRPPIASIN